MAIDIEKLKMENPQHISSQTTDHERRLLSIAGENEAHFYTRLWTIKEALSKVLTTGLMVPLEIYQVEDITYKNGYTVSTFTNFEQYKAISLIYASWVCTLVLPKNTDCLPDFTLVPFSQGK
nr:4'-phosphopantetheinyl transferase superfamily protein [Tunicatimonas sp. TK19036]